MKTGKERSKKQEKRLAKEFKGRVTPASGARHIKGDVLGEQFFIEAKTTSKKQYTLKKETLDKLEREAVTSRKIPALIIQFEMDRREFAIISKEDLQALAEKETNGK